MSMSKNAWVSEVWNPIGDGDGWTPLFTRAFNDWEIDLVERLLQKIHAFRVQREEEDSVIWTASNDGASQFGATSKEGFSLANSEGNLSWVEWRVCGEKAQEGWQMAPLCIFWSVWKERNRLAFGDEDLSLQRLDRLLVGEGGVYTPCILRGHRFLVFPLFV
ncbi:hypothetical protein CK203_089255 [Vitis vinifera]|uniref:Uncharacterized protein n=1 Tax=Vitis vinifera TaxID=29760 RepID=A0A438D008_VITVI|nr:hypothetical protein CK203_089255 [Vitis vinifera]